MLAFWQMGRTVILLAARTISSTLLSAHLEDAASPLEGQRVRKVEDSLNQTPMFYLGMKSPRVALLRCHDTSRNSPTSAQPREEP
jgi:hypothetical protein